jgi:hypothetical protein
MFPPGAEKLGCNEAQHLGKVDPPAICPQSSPSILRPHFSFNSGTGIRLSVIKLMIKPFVAYQVPLLRRGTDGAAGDRNPGADELSAAFGRAS